MRAAATRQGAAALLRILMRTQQASATEVARLTDSSVAAVNSWRRADRGVPLDKLTSAAQALGYELHLVATPAGEPQGPAAELERYRQAMVVEQEIMAVLDAAGADPAETTTEGRG